MKRGTSIEFEYESLLKYKWVLLIINVFVFFTSLATFGICLWIRFDLDFREWVREMDWYTYWYCMYVIMIAMVVVVLNTLLSLYGVLFESAGSLVCTQIFHVVSMIMEFIGCVCISVYGVEESETLTDQLNDVFLELIYKSDYDHRAMRILRMVQEYVGCCGSHGSEDYIKALKPVPMECRDQVTGREYRYGCSQQMAWWLEPWTATLAAICIALILSHIVQMILSQKLANRVREYERADDYDYDYD